MLDVLVDNSPYSQLVAAGIVFTGYMATTYAYDRLTEDQNEGMNIYEADAWLEGREEEYQKRWKSSDEEEIGEEDVKNLLEEE